MPHMNWIDPSWSDEPCSPEEVDTRVGKMWTIIEAINKVLGFDPNCPSALAERKAQEDYSKAVAKAKLDNYHTMTQALHDYHKARDVKGCDIKTIEMVCDRISAKATRRYSMAKAQAFKDYTKASLLAEAERSDPAARLG